jgi:acetoin utilization deacetylase AcuC-like enzyme
MEVISHPDMARLHPTGDHPETQERLRVLHDRFSFREAAAASEEDVLRCHAPALLERIRSVSGPTLIGLDTVGSETTFEVALVAAGAAMAAADDALRVRRRDDRRLNGSDPTLGGFALVRPPGHHATRQEAMGFCFFNNVAIAARYAQSEYGVGRIAILDWDVHHGNGTEAIFWNDPSVLYVSMHQWPFYPGTGGPDDQSETLVNVPLAAGSTDEDYLAAFDALVAPAIQSFEPELLLVSAGFDAHEEDPIAQMLVTEAGFRELARRSARLAPRVAAVLEGGYNLETLPRLVEAGLDGFGS